MVAWNKSSQTTDSKLEEAFKLFFSDGHYILMTQKKLETGR
jgi:hypothetical protein